MVGWAVWEGKLKAYKELSHAYTRKKRAEEMWDRVYSNFLRDKNPEYLALAMQECITADSVWLKQSHLEWEREMKIEKNNEDREL